MYIPSGELRKFIQSEEIGVWAETYKSNTRTALIIKSPTTAVKSIAQGCRIQLVVGINYSNNKHLSIGVIIHDIEEHPMFLPMTPRTIREINGIKGLVNSSVSSFSIYDEMDAPVLSGKIHLKVKNKDFYNLVTQSDFSVAPNAEELEKILDAFCYAVNPIYKTRSWHKSEIDIFDVRLTIEEQPLVTISSEHNSFAYNPKSFEEGFTQESQLYHSLQHIFPENVYHAPLVTVGKKERELTDIFVLNNYIAICFESKALALNESGYRMSRQSRTSKTIKHANKAIRQLVGCSKIIRKNGLVTTNKGVALNLDLVTTIHGVVVITEYITTENWMPIIQSMESLSKNNGIFLHLMDFKQLINIIKISLNPVLTFEKCLNQRFEAVVKHKTLDIDCRDGSLPFLA